MRKLLTIGLLIVALTFAGCNCNTGNNGNNSGDSSGDDGTNGGNGEGWVDNGEGTGEYFTKFIVSSNDNTERYTTKQTPVPFTGLDTDVMYNASKTAEVVSNNEGIISMPAAKETNHYDGSFYEGKTFLEGIYNTTVIMRYDNAPYKTTWEDGTITYTIRPYLFVNYQYDATHDWMYGTCTTGLKSEDYTYSTLIANSIPAGDPLSGKGFIFMGYADSEELNMNLTIPDGTYTYVYLPSGSNDQNDLVYDKKNDKPTRDYLISLFGGLTGLTLVKSKSNNAFIILPVIVGKTPDSNADEQTPTDDSSEIPPDNDGVPTR
jgi:hypothetical protein